MSPAIKTLTRVTIVWLFIGCIGIPSSVFAQDDQAAREAFRQFYEPLLPQLQQSYSQVRFQCALAQPYRGEYRTNFFAGAIGDQKVVYDSFKPVWLSDFQLKRNALLTGFPPQDQRDESWCLLPEYWFRVRFNEQRSFIRIYEGNRRGNPDRSSNPDAIFAPIWCINLLQPYADLPDDQSVEFLEFADGPRGDFEFDVKRLYFRPPGYDEECVFEAVFDAASGRCLATLEFTRNRSMDKARWTEQRRSIEYQSDSIDSNTLSPPVRIITAATESRASGNLYVLTYEPSSDIDPGEFTVQAFGFDDSVFEEPKSFTENVTATASNVLAVIAIALIGLFLFIVALVVLLGLIARNRQRSQSRENASESGLPDAPEDLSV